MTIRIGIDGVSFSYEAGVPVLSDLDLTIEPSTVTALVGRSGCGKSTLLALIGLMEQPSAGSITWDGEATGWWSDRQQARARNRAIGFVYQDHLLDPLLTAVENVRLPLQFAERRIRRATQIEKAHFVLEQVGLEHKAQSGPAELSGGQAQRVAIARALVGEPSLLLVDEPTAALDHKTSMEVLGILTDQRDKHGSTVIVATHDPVVVEQVDRVIELGSVMASAVPGDE